MKIALETYWTIASLLTFALQSSHGKRERKAWKTYPKKNDEKLP